MVEVEQNQNPVEDSPTEEDEVMVLPASSVVERDSEDILSVNQSSAINVVSMRQVLDNVNLYSVAIFDNRKLIEAKLMEQE